MIVLGIADRQCVVRRQSKNRERMMKAGCLGDRLWQNHHSVAVENEGERQLRQAALDSGVLHAAIVNARQTLTAFLHGLGFERVEIDPE